MKFCNSGKNGKLKNNKIVLQKVQNDRNKIITCNIEFSCLAKKTLEKFHTKKDQKEPPTRN